MGRTSPLPDSHLIGAFERGPAAAADDCCAVAAHQRIVNRLAAPRTVKSFRFPFARFFHNAPSFSGQICRALKLTSFSDIEPGIAISQPGNSSTLPEVKANSRVECVLDGRRSTSRLIVMRTCRNGFLRRRWARRGKLGGVAARREERQLWLRTGPTATKR